MTPLFLSCRLNEAADQNSRSVKRFPASRQQQYSYVRMCNVQRTHCCTSMHIRMINPAVVVLPLLSRTVRIYYETNLSVLLLYVARRHGWCCTNMELRNALKSATAVALISFMGKHVVSSSLPVLLLSYPLRVLLHTAAAVLDCQIESRTTILTPSRGSITVVMSSRFLALFFFQIKILRNTCERFKSGGNLFPQRKQHQETGNVFSSRE